MAWKKRWPTRGRKALTTRKAFRTFSRKKLQWSMAVCQPCAIAEMEPLEECPNGGVINLLSNDEVRAHLEDKVRVVRVLGDLYFLPGGAPPISNDCLAILNAAQTSFIYMRCALRKDEVVQGLGGVAPGRNPLQCDFEDLATLNEFADGRWIRYWEHSFQPDITLTVNPVYPPFYSHVHGDLAAGTGTIQTECLPCDSEAEVDYLCTGQVKYPGLWRMHIDIKKPIWVGEDQELNLWCGWEMLDLGQGRPAQPEMNYWGAVRMLLEK